MSYFDFNAVILMVWGLAVIYTLRGSKPWGALDRSVYALAAIAICLTWWFWLVRLLVWMVR